MSDFKDFVFLFFDKRVDGSDVLVEDLLDFLFVSRDLVVGDLLILIERFQFVHNIATSVSERDFVVLAHFLDLLAEISAALFGKLREHESDDFAVVGQP